ncbi:unnamed protein product [Prorocentrum cordatum]|uniref:Uncharacterized protein n=1 Tax=Prorocentrum cordatum TaxID=2364126 RepID=A0ABN9S4T7_9DINO|nr:unnamed protein product [Polarella glacialis]
MVFLYAVVNDIYEEGYSRQGKDIAAVKFTSDRAALPPGVGAVNSYGFGRNRTVAQMQQIDPTALDYGTAALAADHLRLRMPVSGGPFAVPLTFGPAGGIGPGAGAGLAAAGAGAPAAVVIPPAGSHLRGAASLMLLADGTWVAVRSISEPAQTYAGRGASSDARLMWSIVTNPAVLSGRLSTQWRGAVAYFTEESFVDWHFPGPHMCFWSCQFIDRRQGGPFDRLRFWRLGPGLSTGDYGGGAYEAYMRAIYTLSYWGGLDVPNPPDGDQMFRRARRMSTCTTLIEILTSARPLSETEATMGCDKKKGRANSMEGEIVRALSELYLGQPWHPVSHPQSFTAGQRQALDNVRDAARRFGAPLEGLTGSGALAEFRVLSDYAGESATVAPLDFDNINSLSLPDEGFMPSEDRARIESEGPRKLYADPALRNPKLHVQLLPALERVALASGATFAGLHVDGGKPIAVAEVDLADAFYTMLLPPNLWICQTMLEGVALKVPQLSFANRFVDRRPVPLVSEGAIHADCVDNAISLSTDLETAVAAASAVDSNLRAAGLPTHGVESSFGAVALGWFDEKFPIVGLIPALRWKLRLAFLELCRRGYASGKTISRVVSHFFSRGLVRRELLAALNSLCAFSAQYGGRTARLWPSCLRELRWCASLVVFCFRNAGAPFDSTLTMVDSSRWGVGVTQKKSSAPVARELSKYNERWRFSTHEESEMSHRPHAFKSATSADPFTPESVFTVDCSGRPKAPIKGPLEVPVEEPVEESVTKGVHMEEEMVNNIEEEEEFPEIPYDVWAKGWVPVVSHRWSRSEHQVVLEARGMVVAFRHVLRRVSSFNRCHLCLGDCLGAILAATKGRSSRREMGRACRQLASLSLASGAAFFWRWVPSERNSADRASKNLPGVGYAAAAADSCCLGAAAGGPSPASGHGGPAGESCSFLTYMDPPQW